METFNFNGNILIIGFGSVGQAILPVLLERFGLTPERVTIVTGDERGKEEAQKYGIQFIINPLKRDNYEGIVLGHVGRGDFLLNVSVDVSSTALIELCQRNGILYLDSCIEPWEGGYTDPSLSITERSNYGFREAANALRHLLGIEGPRPTAIPAYGANPGLISPFVKQALLNIAKDTGHDATPPYDKKGWATLARDLGIKVIHVAERDTQTALAPKKIGEFINTWSIDGFYSEGCQPSEIGWGTHEKEMPVDGKRHPFGCDAAIYLERPGYRTRVRSWTPTAKSQQGWIITHNESISIADHLTLRDDEGKVIYRPTVHYAYHPSDGAVLSLDELAGNNGVLQKDQRLIRDEILPGGVDELGVLLMGHSKNAYWYGSRLSIDEARNLVPYNNATSLQVVAGILGAMVWAIRNPEMGIVEADDVDYQLALEVGRPYLGELFGEYTDWTPLQGRDDGLFPEKMDKDDPWQFSNFRVS